jgi:RNA polymerase sigma-70 factor (ECF subfamily)
VNGSSSSRSSSARAQQASEVLDFATIGSCYCRRVASGVDDGWTAAATQALVSAHAAWPAHWIPNDAFVEHLRARLPPGRDPANALASVAIADLYLACACARGVPSAVEVFARTILGEIDAHVATFDRAPAFADDVRQTLGARLLVAGPGMTPKIADFAGSAPLSAWVRVAAIRVALNLRRGKAASAELANEREAAALAAAGTDAETDLIRRRYGPAFEGAVAGGLAALSPRERTLLRLRLVDGVEVEQIAAMYRVHRTTITRWLGACQASLLVEVRRVLADTLGLTGSEIASLAGVLQSQLHVSLARLLPP